MTRKQEAAEQAMTRKQEVAELKALLERVEEIWGISDPRERASIEQCEQLLARPGLPSPRGEQ